PSRNSGGIRPPLRNAAPIRSALRNIEPCRTNTQSLPTRGSSSAKSRPHAEPRAAVGAHHGNYTRSQRNRVGRSRDSCSDGVSAEFPVGGGLSRKRNRSR